MYSIKFLEKNKEKKIKTYISGLVNNNEIMSLDLILLFLSSLPNPFYLFTEIQIDREKRKRIFWDYLSHISIFFLQKKYDLSTDMAINYIKRTQDFLNHVLEKILEPKFNQDTRNGYYYTNTIQEMKYIFTKLSSKNYKNVIVSTLSNSTALEKGIIKTITALMYLGVEERENFGPARRTFMPYHYAWKNLVLGLTCVCNRHFYSNQSYKDHFDEEFMLLFNLKKISEKFSITNEFSYLKVGKRKFWYNELSDILVKLGIWHLYFSLTPKCLISPSGYNYTTPSFILKLFLQALEKILLNDDGEMVEMSGLRYPKKTVDKYISLGKKAYIKGKFTKSFKEWSEKGVEIMIEKEKKKIKKSLRLKLLPLDWEGMKQKYTFSELKIKNNGFLEKDIEKYVISNLHEVEEGLQFINNQYDTNEVGTIDILCKDKKDNYVIIEIKKGRASDKVVGQIQRYLYWVDNNLSEQFPVRGIIICNSYDQKLKASLQASKYPIELFTLKILKINI